MTHEECKALIDIECIIARELLGAEAAIKLRTKIETECAKCSKNPNNRKLTGWSKAQSTSHQKGEENEG